MNNLGTGSILIELIHLEGLVWLSSVDIAKQLGYAKTDRLTRVYAKHRAEFSPSMTRTIKTPVSGFSGITTETRLFSLRGAHLLGMFSRTAKGQEFRRWVLDQLEGMDQRIISNQSLMAEWYQAKVDLECQQKFASLCGKGLSEHKKAKPPLLDRVAQIASKIQPSLTFS